MIVCLDPGHGGQDSGSMGNNLKEKDINLSVTLKIGAILKKQGIETIYTRETDIFVELIDRARIANKVNANVFVSIHCNWYSDPAAQGVEVYSYASSEKSGKLAVLIQDNIIKDKLYTKNRGTKTANFAVLRRTQMPAALVELGFISNRQDADILENKQDELANTIAKGILQYLGVKYQDDKQDGDMISKIKINLNGKIKDVQIINKAGYNFVRLQDIRDEKIAIEYDGMPIIKVINEV